MPYYPWWLLPPNTPAKDWHTLSPQMRVISYLGASSAELRSEPWLSVNAKRRRFDVI
jgi:hypothetical protein